MDAHTPRIKQTYIAGAGVSGALLAGAAIVFISLVGLVSFAIWPQSRDGADTLNPALDPVRSAGSSGSPAAVSAPAPAEATTTVAPAALDAGAKGTDRKAGNGNRSRGETNNATVRPAAAPVTSPAKSSNPGNSGDGGRSSRDQEGSSGKSSSGNGSTRNGSTRNASSGNGSTRNASSGNGSTRNGSSGNGSSGNGSSGKSSAPKKVKAKRPARGQGRGASGRSAGAGNSGR